MKTPPWQISCLQFFVQDIETFDLEDFKYNFVNMTAFRIVDAEDVGVREILKDMERFQPVGHSILNKSRIIQVEMIEKCSLFIFIKYYLRWHIKKDETNGHTTLVHESNFF